MAARRRIRVVVRAGLCACLAAGAIGAGAIDAGAAPAAPPAAQPKPTPAHPSTYSVPPAAPLPTDSGKSPDSPDPHPPRGGIGPDGRAVGGTRLLSRGLVQPAGVPALPSDLTAQSWILVDLDSGAVLAARDPHGRYQPASILKILTSVTLLPLLPGSRRVTVTAAAAHAEGSAAGLVPGGTYTVDQLFEGLLLASGNDTAAALADAAGGTAHTVAMMNRTALGLGAYDTLAQTPSGLDGWQQLTSAYDMSLFLRAALADPRFIAYEQARSAVLPVQPSNGYGPVTMDNQNTLFLSTVPGALVAKTGYTDAAQHTFAGAISRGGRRLGVILMRAQRWPQDQWQQATDLMNWGFALPAGTAPVGHLAPPVPVPAAAKSLAPGATARQAAIARLGAGGRTGWVVWVVIAAVLGVLVPLWWLGNRRNRAVPAPTPPRRHARSRSPHSAYRRR
jgi:D-alanyl-D-alanine carboxypeptidase (penicillin-binding protein 5/6)